ncbi:MAG TPA: PspC domain-containing protein [Gemmatimonas sp.]|nr:PspC domain-containing protein [Gemmatimonas sp.]
MQKQRLKRSDDSMIAGVCGGIADYLGWSPSTTRLAYLMVSAFSAGFPGLLVYIVLWFVMPPPGANDDFRLDNYRQQ